MIKRILVALDPDTDTPVATSYAADIAVRAQAEVTGIAVVDMGSIEASSRGGGIGSMYLMEKVQGRLTAEARTVARELTSAFHQTMEASGVDAHAHIEEGVPVERIMEDMNYHDVLVVGKDPHFFYSHPDRTSMTLEEVVKNVVGPTLVVPDARRSISRALVAFDGSRASARAMQSFVHLQPFGAELPLDIVNIHSKGEREGSQLVLRMAKSYVETHGFRANISSIRGENPSAEIMQCLERFHTDLVVAGAHFVSPLARMAFGSTTASFLHMVAVPMWLDS